ncbi:MAG: glycosyltransferase [Candidatus Beckwithbacteria bacterium]|nr:glycosyltransferase [Candidatus Beckwithbacteria bacterium]
MTVALVYDRVNKFGGAEKILLALHQLWPKAPLFTAVYDPKGAPWAKVFPEVIPSFLQSFPWAKTHHELYPWLTPVAFESFDFKGYDLVVSVTSAEAKAIITRPETHHLCYCLTPTRYLWSHRQEYLQEPGLGSWLKPWQPYLRNNDLVYSQRPDTYIAISKTVQQRIKRYYRRDSTVIYPPVDTARFSRPRPRPRQPDYFLIVSRLVAYKQIDLAIQAFNRLKLPLVIIGQGRDRPRLERLAGPTISFTGWVSEVKLIAYLQNCQALIMPQEEDFGIAAVEVQAAGRPVIAFGRGGATETVINHQTGWLFPKMQVDSLIAAVKQFKARPFETKKLILQAKKFDTKIFMKAWQTYQ